MLIWKYLKFMEEDIRSAVADNADSAGSGGDAAAEPVDPVAALTEERNQLAAQKAELQDRYLRLQAEFENSRRRAERDRLEFAEYAGMEMARALLPTLDDLERALKSATETGVSADDFVKGVQLIYNRLTDTLKKHGVEPVETEGSNFDPHLHHAVQRVQMEDVEDGTILEVYQRGYNFKGKLLRPAMVKVAVRA
jgi:molecular chaperone GrpE